MQFATNALGPRRRLDRCVFSLLVPVVSACTLTDYSYLGAASRVNADGGAPSTTATAPNPADSPAEPGSAPNGREPTGSADTAANSESRGGAASATRNARGGAASSVVGAGGNPGSTSRSTDSSPSSRSGPTLSRVGSGGTPNGASQGGSSTSALGANKNAIGGSSITTIGGSPFNDSSTTGGRSNATGSSPINGGSTTGGNASSSIAMGGSIAPIGSTVGAAAGSETIGGSSSGSSITSAGSAATTNPVTCSGCARLDVPFTAEGQLARYLLRFSPVVTVNQHATTIPGETPTVLHAGTLKLRAYAPKLGNSHYEMLIQQSNGMHLICYSPVQPMPNDITSSWVTLEWSLASCAGSDGAIGRLGLDLITTSDQAPSTTTLWIDSIWIELNDNTIAGPFDFDSANSVDPSVIANDFSQIEGILYLRPTVARPPVGNGVPPTGSAISWFGN